MIRDINDNNDLACTIPRSTDIVDHDLIGSTTAISDNTELIYVFKNNYAWGSNESTTVSKCVSYRELVNY